MAKSTRKLKDIFLNGTAPYILYLDNDLFKEFVESNGILSST